MGIVAAFMVPHPPVILPEIGRGEEKKIQKTTDAYEEAARRLGACRPETIVLISPHQVMYGDYFHISPGRGAEGDFSDFHAPQVKFRVTYDTEFADSLCGIADGRRLPAGTLGERDKRLDHGTMVPLYFINQYWKEYRLVRIGLSGLPLARHYELGQCIQEVADALGRRTALVASGDLSHRLKEDGPYGYREEGPVYDQRIMQVMGEADFGELLEFTNDLCEKAAECGHRSFTMMAGALDKSAVSAERLSYEGTFGVGYGICAYEVLGTDGKRNFGDRYQERKRQELARQRENEDAYVRLARRTIEAYTRTGKKPSVPDGLPEEMTARRAGVFVSVKKEGMLRGCIGTIQSVYGSVAEEIVENAVAAVSRDPRFPQVTEDELEQLAVSVDVLGETERIQSPDELDAGRYGVIVSRGSRRGLLLPNLEGVESVEQQIAIAREKAGIDALEEVALERFEVVRHF